MANQRTYGFNRVLATGTPVPNAGVAVYDQGTLNLSTIFSDTIGTPKANPFLSDANGYWFFYATNGRYDVSISTLTGAFVPGAATNYTLGDIEVSAFISINGLTSDTQLFATGSAGTDFGIVSAASTHTFNIPSASAVNRGLVTTGAQTFAGLKTFSTPIALGSGGTGLSTAPTAGQLLIGTVGNVWGLGTLAGAGSVSVGYAAGVWTITGAAQGISSLNALTDATQTFAVGTAGTDFAISSASPVHTFNIPDAGAAARGLVTTGAQTLAGNKTLSGVTTLSQAPIFSAGIGAQTTFTAGTGTGATRLSGVVNSQASTAGVGNVSTGETTLFSFTLPANSLAVNGQVLRVSGVFTCVTNGNNKTLKCYLGGFVATLINASPLNLSGGGSFVFNFTRVGPTTQIANGFGLYGSNTTAVIAQGFNTGILNAGAETLSNALLVKLTGQSNTASNDVIAYSMLSEIVG